RRDQAVTVKCSYRLLTEPIDVECVARNKMFQSLDPLRLAYKPARAPPHGVASASPLIDLAHGMAAAYGTCRRKPVRLRSRRPLLDDDRHNLRDDVPGALNDHRIADPYVLACDLVLVVQRSIGNDDPSDRHRLKLSDRGQCPCAPHLNLDIA